MQLEDLLALLLNALVDHGMVETASVLGNNPNVLKTTDQ